MAKSRTTHTLMLFECPACNQDVYGRATIDIHVESMDATGMKLNGKLLGIAVNHDCTPAVTR